MSLPTYTAKCLAITISYLGIRVLQFAFKSSKPGLQGNDHDFLSLMILKRRQCWQCCPPPWFIDSVDDIRQEATKRRLFLVMLFDFLAAPELCLVFRNSSLLSIQC